MLLPIRLWTLAMLVRGLKHVVPLPLLVRWTCPSHRPDTIHQGAVSALDAYLARRGSFPWRPPGNCLDRSLAAYRVLCASGASPRLVVGIRPAARGLDGHVWLTLDGRPFAERADLAAFVSIVSFDAHGVRDSSAGTADLTGIRWA